MSYYFDNDTHNDPDQYWSSLLRDVTSHNQNNLLFNSSVGGHFYNAQLAG
jgi:hypothetical protein